MACEIFTAILLHSMYKDADKESNDSSDNTNNSLFNRNMVIQCCKYITNQYKAMCKSIIFYNIKQYFLSVCLSVCMLSSHHGFVFQFRDVWFSLNGFKFFVLGVSVLKKNQFCQTGSGIFKKHQNSGSFTLKTKVVNRI